MAKMAAGTRSLKYDDTDKNVLLFGSHVPTLLLQRCFQYLLKEKGLEMLPFIERFEGSLLFVDISG
jgi:hypothetical protein